MECSGKYVHGTRFVSSQIASAVATLKAIPKILPLLQDQIRQPESIGLAFCKNMGCWSPISWKVTILLENLKASISMKEH
jgi:hypothetical protein